MAKGRPNQRLCEWLRHRALMLRTKPLWVFAVPVAFAGCTPEPARVHECIDTNTGERFSFSTPAADEGWNWVQVIDQDGYRRTINEQTLTHLKCRVVEGPHG